MPRTLEERMVEELDGLYSGAVFLCGGAAECAEDLVLQTTRSAASQFSARPLEGSFTRWLEELMVRAAWEPLNVDAAHGGESGLSQRDAAPDSAGLDGAEWADLVRAAAAVPRGPRIALWLVLLRRWQYGEAEEVLGIERATLRKLLAYRRHLLNGLLAIVADRTERGTGS